VITYSSRKYTKGYFTYTGIYIGDDEVELQERYYELDTLDIN